MLITRDNQLKTDTGTFYRFAVNGIELENSNLYAVSLAVFNTNEGGKAWVIDKVYCGVNTNNQTRVVAAVELNVYKGTYTTQQLNGQIQPDFPQSSPAGFNQQGDPQNNFQSGNFYAYATLGQSLEVALRIFPASVQFPPSTASGDIGQAISVTVQFRARLISVKV